MSCSTQLPAYAVPGTDDHAERQQLSHELLHCRDYGRAGEISRRIKELRDSSVLMEIVTETVEDMEVGDVRYTVPWALQVHEDGGHTIRADYTTEPEPLRTSTMRVARREDGFEVDVRPCAWYSAPCPGPTWTVTSRFLGCLPVVSVTGEVKMNTRIGRTEASS